MTAATAEPAAHRFANSALLYDTMTCVLPSVCVLCNLKEQMLLRLAGGQYAEGGVTNCIHGQ